MAEGKSKKPFEYILKDDRELPEKEHTIWTLKPFTNWDAGELANRFEQAKYVRKGKSHYDPRTFNQGQIATFRQIVVEVKNYKFSVDYPELRDKGWMDIPGEDVHTIKCLFDDIDPEWYTELIDAADKNARLDLEDKKKSKSSPTSSHGNGTTSNKQQKDSPAKTAEQTNS